VEAVFQDHLNELSLMGATKTRIIVELRGSRRKTASEIARELKIQVSAVRKHLDAMHDAGIVAQEFVRDGIGRPKKFYSLSELGRELFPRQYEAVLNALIEKLIASADRAFVEKLMKRIASDLLRPKTSLSLSSSPAIDEKLERLTESMSAFGFQATVERKDGSVRIASHNCPLYKSAKKYPDLICKGIHGEMIRSALGIENVKLERCLLSGDRTCVHSFEQAQEI
jgi:predicted ArsR family transcriptional regulator